MKGLRLGRVEREDEVEFREIRLSGLRLGLAARFPDGAFCVVGEAGRWFRLWVEAVGESLHGRGWDAFRAELAMALQVPSRGELEARAEAWQGEAA